VFYVFWRCFFRQDTFFRWKRIALIGLLFLSVIYPFVDIRWGFGAESSLENTMEDILAVAYQLPEITISGTGDRGWMHHFPLLLLGIYGLGVIVLLLRLLIQTGIIAGIVHASQNADVEGRNVYRNPVIQTPFSFFRWIVLDPDRYTPRELSEILRHEETHVREAHSVDILLAEIFCMFAWMNPFAWLLKREIQLNLEFLADRSVLASGYEAEHYQFHLLRLTYHRIENQIVNNFNVSLLKKRIFMMNKKQTSKVSICKYALLAPVVGALLFFNSAFTAPVETSAGDLSQESLGTVVQDSIPKTKGKVAAVKISSAKRATDNPSPSEPEIYDKVDVMPEFPGGSQALVEWLSQNIRYPQEAVKNGIQGRVVVKFVVNAEGSVTDRTIVKSLDPSCDAEALRVVSAMPAWTPGKKDGKAVAVYYFLPILFQNSDAEKTQAKEAEGGEGDVPNLPSNVQIIVDGEVITSADLPKIDPKSIENINVIKDGENPRVIITLKK
jgi:TonB family protein